MFTKLTTELRQILTSKLGVDGKVASGLLSKLATMMLGPIGSAIIVLKLDGEIQGIYYLFLSIVALRSFFELGVGMSITQIAAHEKIIQSGQAIVHPAMVLASMRWLRVASVWFGLLVGAGGAAFLISKGYTQFSVLGAWCLFIVVSALRFAFDGVWSILTGADYVKESNYLLLLLQLLLYAIQWTLLLLGTGLYAFALSSLVIFLVQSWVVRRKYSWLFPSPDEVLRDQVAEKRSQLITLLKRSSQTFLTGYFVFQIQQPICFHLVGPLGSAKLGFTQIIGMAFLTVPMIWVQSAFPSVAALVGNGETTTGWNQFKLAWLRALGLTFLCFVGAVLAMEILRQFPRFSERLMSRQDGMILFIGLAIQTMASSITYWPRAFKVEPFVLIAYIQMIATPVLLWLLVANYGLTGVGLATVASWIIGTIGITLASSRFVPRLNNA
jgi:hypothetical protein